MYVACSTLCFARLPLDRALRIIGELEFGKVDIAFAEKGPHLKPSDVAADIGLASQRIRIGPSLTPGAFRVEIEAPDAVEYQRQFRALCRLAHLSTVATITIPAAPNTTPFEEEVIRLARLVKIAEAEGIILSVGTWMNTLAELPQTAVDLCEAVPGLALTLDPSHFLVGPHEGDSFDMVYPYVCHVHLRDTGRRRDQFQVRVGQGQVEYGRIVSHLGRFNYDRLLTVDIHDIADAPFVMESEVRKLKFLLESLV